MRVLLLPAGVGPGHFEASTQISQIQTQEPMLSPRVLAVFALFSGSASGLVLPGARAGAAAPTFDRRQALSAGFNAALATAALAAPAAVHAYDAIPTVEADFAEMERARRARRWQERR